MESSAITPCPEKLGGGRVLCWLSLEHASRIHLVSKFEGRTIVGVAICFIDTDDAYFLFGCDENWRVLTDTWHRSREEAQCQADFEYPGCEGQWINAL
jgi:hypothetical protein